MIRRAFILIVLAAAALSAGAQQHSLYSQYIFNLYAVNPAYAGERNAASLGLSYRSQWVGFDGAPKTAYFSAHSPIRTKNMALGVWFQNEQVGAREHNSIHGTFSYKVKLDDESKISFGLSAGALNHTYNWNELDFPDGSDPVAFVDEANQWRPMFDFGVMYISKQTYAGLSVFNLNGTELTSVDFIDARLDPAFNLIAGHIFPISKQVDLKPSALVRAQADGTWTYDANLSARFKNMFWLTATYRHEFGMVFSGHVYLNDQFHFGYSYDLTTNSLLSQQSGTHEIFIGYDLNLYRDRSTIRKDF